MDLEIEKNLKWLRRGPIGLYLLNYAKKLLIEEDTLRIIIAYLLAQRPLPEISHATNVDQERLNMILRYRWAVHVQKKPYYRPAESRAGDPEPISEEHERLIKELMALGVKHRDIREHFKINLRSWNVLFKNA